MEDKMESANGVNGHTQYSPVSEARRIFNLLIDKPELRLMPILGHRKDLEFTSDKDDVYIPIPFKEVETTAALKAIEAGLVAGIADLRRNDNHRRAININLEKVACFLLSAYLATVNGFGKLDPRVKEIIKNTDLLAAQSILYRRMSANLYRTREPGRFYHIHGSLEATKTLNMIGLPAERPDLTDMEDVIDVIESHVQKFTVDELEELNSKNRQAGVECLKHEDFLNSKHGQAHNGAPPWELETLEDDTLPAAFPPPSQGAEKRPLNGIRVLELCRVIAGPMIGRIMAEHGADVLKITAGHLPDVPFFQIDGNMSKRCADLDLNNTADRQTFHDLLLEADVVLDGYRPGALEKFGYGPAAITEMAKQRGKGYVYVKEDCFGYKGPWAYRPGWQQIADCVSGVAWAEGQFLGLDGPLVPPFPMSDYGTGCMGVIAALTGLYHRAKYGGSYFGKVSLLQYDLLLFEVGRYSPEVQRELLDKFVLERPPKIKMLRHHHSVDHVSHTVLELLKEVKPELFDCRKYCEKWYSEKYDADLTVVKPVAEIEGLEVSFSRASRPNGSDKPTWEFDGRGKDRKIDW